MSLGQLLRRGLVSGAAAGLCAAVVLWLVVEPVVRRALSVEDRRGAVAHQRMAAPLVSRTVQQWGGIVTVLVVGALFGAIFAVVFARCRQALPAASDLGRSVVLAALGFGVFALLPALKMPANPPAVGNPATVTERTLLYVLTILLGALGVGAVTGVNGLLRGGRLSAPVRVALDAAVGLAWVVAVLVLVPGSPDAVPADVPAALLWDFRVASLAQLATMWLVAGLVFGVLVDSRTRTGRLAVSAGVLSDEVGDKVADAGLDP